MAKILVTYYSQTGHTQSMAEQVMQGAEAAGARVTVSDIQHISVQDLPGYDGIIIGSPTYYGLMAGSIKELIDQSVQYHGQLAGKIGGAFASSANIGGGNETTVLSILQVMLVHGMVVQGSATGDHYGPVGINVPDERVKKQCQALGRRVAELAIKLFG
ncbi:MAG: flavodoxin family protein [Phycisphaerae bacterium]|jgi:NAD(P)H dehydrogenase (quinone)|nr:flavodoxin family protein [Phycisphaerae bacterium]